MTKEQDKLVTANMGYVVTLARQYKSDILSTDDLVSEGAIGLMKAAEKYDASKGKPFVTFAAPYIRRAIEKAISRLTTDIDTRSTDESLPVGSRNNYTLLNVLEDKNAVRANAAVEEITLTDDLLKCMNVLNEREQRVVNLYYGNGYERSVRPRLSRYWPLATAFHRMLSSSISMNLPPHKVTHWLSATPTSAVVPSTHTTATC